MHALMIVQGVAISAHHAFCWAIKTVVRQASKAFANGHPVSTYSECTCAVNSGTCACSETSLSTVKICMMSSSMNKVGTASNAKANEM